ncbi:2OG-Fe(II) oxygenase [Pseudomonas sp. KU26590]|uniref:2OG-Fe(II) oxygenase n=1 Tax=Pseudomonas sp. KU26590 TaxID=2991051 RepID=UPI00223C8F17|nr:2OG-Fe(II) oxygenase [Pseudomonas sp. KU26590]UZJ61913.1 2OG-Fe(II) oxygenase [Pseudomonas sp. KU26590]
MKLTTEGIAHELRSFGVAYLPPSSGIYDEIVWQEIDLLIKSPDLPWEKILIGDADEKNDLHVARFMTDIDIPKYVNLPHSLKMKDLVCQPELMNIFTSLFDAEEFFIRRMQVNKMQTNSYIGKHLDIDSNPDYSYSIVLQLGDGFSGGEFTVYDQAGSVSRSIKPALASVVISDCTFAHEVETVTAGNRISLVFFVSKYADHNRRSRPPQTPAMA